MTELNNYYVLQIAKNDGDYKYVGVLYPNSINKYDSVDDAMKFPDKETPKQLGKYICWREENTACSYSYKVLEVKTTMEEVEYE